MRLDKRQIRKIIMEEMSRLNEEMSPFSPEQEELLIHVREFGSQDFANLIADMMKAKTKDRAKDAAYRAYRITKRMPELYDSYIEATDLTNFDSGIFMTRQRDPEPPPGYYADQADEHQYYSQIYSKYHRPSAPKPTSSSEPRMSGKERLDRGGDLDRFKDRPGALDESSRISQGRLLQIIKEELSRAILEAEQKSKEVSDDPDEMNEGPADDDYYGDDDPFGDDEAIEKGLEYDPRSAGYKQPVDDYYGDDDPFGDDEAIEQGLEYVPGSGYKKPDVEDDYYGDDDPFGDDEAILKGYKPDQFGGYHKPKNRRSGSR